MLGGEQNQKMWQIYSTLRLSMGDLIIQPHSLAKRIEIAICLEKLGDPRFAEILLDVFEKSIASHQGLEALWGFKVLSDSMTHKKQIDLLTSLISQEKLDSLAHTLAQTFSLLLDAKQNIATELPSLQQAEEILASDQGTQDIHPNSPTKLSDAQLVDAAYLLSKQALELPKTPKPIPFFSALSADLIVSLLPHLQLKDFGLADILVEEGEQSLGLYLICSGKVNISRRNQQGQPIELATLYRGAVVGEMALLTNSPRVATVIAKEAVQTITLKSDAYPLLETEKEQIKALLSKQVGARMLQNLVKCSPIFQSISKESQQELLNLFESEIAQPNEILVAQGKPGRGLFLILDGSIKINRRGELNAKWLREGDVFGEISLLNQSPATATCSAVRKTLLYRLSPEKFAQIKDQHPEVIQILSELSLYRSLDELFSLI
jgi:CRP-like cAMP-binding protein